MIVNNSSNLPYSGPTLEHVKWLHGTTSVVLKQLPFLDFTLTPTGKLLPKRIAPLGGELSMGIGYKGVNQKQISGMDIKKNNAYSVVWQYANLKPDFENFEEKRINKINSTIDKFIKKPSMTAKEAFMLSIQILQLRQWNEPLFQENCNEKLKGVKEEILTAAFKIFFSRMEQIKKAIEIAVSETPDMEGDYLNQFLEDNFGITAEWIDDNVLGYQIENRLESYRAFMTKRKVIETIGFQKQADELVISIIALKNHDPKFFQERKDVLVKAVDKMKKLTQSYQQNIEQALSEEATPMQLTKEDKDDLKNKAAFPLLLASTQDLRLKTGFGGHGEAAAKDPLRLGKEIDVIITSEENVDFIQQYISQQIGLEIAVYSNIQAQKVFNKSE